MKKVFQSVFQVSALCALLFACKKESFDDTQRFPKAEARQSANSLIPLPKTYTLIKHGADTIIFQNGKILKVQRDAANYTEYFYGPSSAYGATYVNGVMDNGIQYLYDATGKVERTWHTSWPLVNGVPTKKETHFFYEYTIDGKLKKRYNGLTPGERSEYIYDQNGNLKEVQYFLTMNGQPYRKLFLAYSINNSRPVADKLNLNFRHSGFDPHMKVYGTFSKHLPLSVKIQEMGLTKAEENHAYTLNADGYPIRCDITNKTTSHTESIGFKYQAIRAIN